MPTDLPSAAQTQRNDNPAAEQGVSRNLFSLAFVSGGREIPVASAPAQTQTTEQ